MFKSDIALKKRLVFLSALTLLSSNNVFAEIYKWQNARGVTQYSDAPPLTGYTKVTRNELLNSIQSKDVCTVGPVKKNIALATSQAKNFSSFFDAVKKTSSTISQLGISSTSTSSTTYFGNTSASLSGSSTKRPVKNTRTTSTTTTPIATTTTPITITTAPTTTTTTTSTQPLIVATTTPTTTSTTNIVQTAMMPAVDISKNVTQATGYTDFRIQPTTEVAPPNGGAFRVPCAVSHMSNDDPMVYPNQPGAAHHHTFFGNTTTNAKSDLMTLASAGNSTCNGGIMNRSAYWVPSMIDTKTNTPLVPDGGALFYYKTGDFSAPAVKPITAPPKGLRMIAGNSKATTASTAEGSYTCITAAGTTPWQPNIVNCAVGDTMQEHITFPQCWDGVNLDSPDHKSHMSYRVNSPGVPAACPSSHPVMIPEITLNLNYKITVPNQTATWRLASDNYTNTSPGGYSTHADWVNGWDEKTMQGIVDNCLNKNLDGHAHLLCDGRTFF